MSVPSRRALVVDPDYPGWYVLSAKEVGSTLHRVLGPRKRPVVCPSCLTQGPWSLLSSGTWTFQDLPCAGKHVSLTVRRISKCGACAQTVFHPLPWQAENVHAEDRDSPGRRGRAVTHRLLMHILAESVCQTNVAIAAEVGLSERTIRNIVKDQRERDDARMLAGLRTPGTLGIEAANIHDHYRWLLTNVDACTLLDILPDLSIDRLKDWLQRLPGRDRIKHVCVGVHAMEYQATIQRILPHAHLALNPIDTIGGLTHVAYDALQAIVAASYDDSRAAVRVNARQIMMMMVERERWLVTTPGQPPSIEPYIQDIPRLSAAYDLAALFMGMYEATTLDEFEVACEAWQASAEAASLPEFRVLLRAVTDWFPALVRGWDQDVPDDYEIFLSYVERLLLRYPRDQSFGALRQRVLHELGLRKHVTESAEQPVSQAMPNCSVQPMRSDRDSDVSVAGLTGDVVCPGEAGPQLQDNAYEPSVAHKPRVDLGVDLPKLVLWLGDNIGQK